MSTDKSHYAERLSCSSKEVYTSEGFENGKKTLSLLHGRT